MPTLPVWLSPAPASRSSRTRWRRVLRRGPGAIPARQRAERAASYLQSLRVAWQRAHARAELSRDLARRPPRVIVVQHGDVFPFVTGDMLDSALSLQGFPELSELLRGSYRFVESVEDLDVYQRI